MLGQVRAWLRLFRAHTVILEAPLAVLGAGLALGSIYEPVILLWAVFGITYHLVGYGMNSYVDWEKGFDKDDPEKQHHPLNTGEIRPERAKQAIFGMFGGLILLGLYLGNFSVLAFASMIVMVVSGMAYNYLGKYTVLKFIPISVVHTMVFVYPFLVYAKSVTNAFLLIACAYFVHHVFQIAISGDVKDIAQDEASLIKSLGSRVTRGLAHEMMFYPTLKVLYLAYLLTIVQVALVLAATILLGNTLLYVSPLVIASLWMLYEVDRVISAGPYHRESRVSHMSRKELAGYATIHSSMIPVIGLDGIFVIFVLMLSYLVTSSKFMWGNWIKPDV